MQTLTQVVIGAGLGSKVLHDGQLAVVLEGSAQRRYNLVNRALVAGELVRLKRGCYVLHPAVTGTKPHGFVVAQYLQPGSFISFETALAWHGWIPEEVRLIASVVPGRRKAEYSLPLWATFALCHWRRTWVRIGWGGRIELTGGIGLRQIRSERCWI